MNVVTDANVNHIQTVRILCALTKVFRCPTATGRKRLGIGNSGDLIGNVKPRCTINPTGAFTRNELWLVIGVVALLATLLPPALASAKRKAQRIQCVNNLKQFGDPVMRLWIGDHGEKFPGELAATNESMMELLSSGNAYVLWQSMSDDLGTPKILFCPADTNHIAATNFTTGFSDANISYFLSLNAVEIYPEMVLIGDDNLTVGGGRVRPGIFSFGTNTPVAWTDERHRREGNIGTAEGSAWQLTSEGLNSVLVSDFNDRPAQAATNRWVIP
jgi:hypothetical protein